MQLFDGGPLTDQRAVIGLTFLELVRLGVLRPGDPRIVQFAHRRGSAAGLLRPQRAALAPREFRWIRRKGADGSEWEPTDAGSGITHGRGWPLLTGERGEYQLAVGAGAQSDLDTVPVHATSRVGCFRSMCGTTSRRPAPDRTSSPASRTFSATPLAWRTRSPSASRGPSTPAPRSRRPNRSLAATRARSAVTDPCSVGTASTWARWELVSPQLTRRTAPVSPATRVVASGPAEAARCSRRPPRGSALPMNSIYLPARSPRAGNAAS